MKESKIHSVPLEPIPLKPRRKHFTKFDAHELRQQMYMFLIVNGFANDKKDAIALLKKKGFLTNEKHRNDKPCLVSYA